jgi:hypothetical protein
MEDAPRIDYPAHIRNRISDNRRTVLLVNLSEPEKTIKGAFPAQFSTVRICYLDHGANEIGTRSIKTHRFDSVSEV